jgi:hypothetical protein
MSSVLLDFLVFRYLLGSPVQDLLNWIEPGEFEDGTI